MSVVFQSIDDVRRNISSPSKIQRSPEKELQPNTIRNLESAQDSLHLHHFLSKKTHKVHATSLDHHGVKEFRRQNFVDTAHIQSYATLQTVQASARAAPLHYKSATGVFSSLITSNEQTTAEGAESARSIRSTSSEESFKSALSVQQTLSNSDGSHDLKPIRTVLHAFQTAIEILNTMITKQSPTLSNISQDALNLKASLEIGETTIRNVHIENNTRLHTAYRKVMQEQSPRKYLFLLKVLARALSLVIVWWIFSLMC